MAGVTGLEPATSGVTGRRSNQLSYTPNRRCASALRRRERSDRAPRPSPSSEPERFYDKGVDSFPRIPRKAAPAHHSRSKGKLSPLSGAPTSSGQKRKPRPKIPNGGDSAWPVRDGGRKPASPIATTPARRKWCSTAPAHRGRHIFARGHAASGVQPAATAARTAHRRAESTPGKARIANQNQQWLFRPPPFPCGGQDCRCLKTLVGGDGLEPPTLSV